MRNLFLVLILFIFACKEETEISFVDNNSPSSIPIDLILNNWNSFSVGQEYMYYDDRFSNIVNGKINNGIAQLNRLVLKQGEIFEGETLLTSSGEIDGVNLKLTAQNLQSLSNLFYIQSVGIYTNPYYKESQSFERFLSALDIFLSEYYSVGVTHYGNWWNWEIGINKMLMNILALIYKDISKELLTKAINVSRYMAPDANYIFNSEGTRDHYKKEPSTGANKTDLGQIAFIRGLVDRKEDEILSAVSIIGSTLGFSSYGDGFYTDGSVIQHKDYAYVGGYGSVLLEGISKVYYALSNTNYPFDLLSYRFIYDVIFLSFEPSLFKSQIIEGVRGRSPSRGWSVARKEAQGIIQSFIRLYAVAKDQEKQRLGSLIKGHLLSPDPDRPQYLIENYANDFIPLAIALNEIVIDDSLVSKDILEGNFLFYNMDRVVHRAEDWLFAISGHSNRIANYECINGENLLGWRTGDGMTYIYDTDQEQYFNYWPMMPELSPPGVTANVNNHPLPCSNMADGNDKKQDMDWVGGVSTRNFHAQGKSFGSFGMKFISFDQDVSIKKSWFMFDEEIIALGSDLNSNDIANTLSMIDFRKIKSNASNLIYINDVLQTLGTTELDYQGIPTSIYIEGDIKSSSRGYLFNNADDVFLKRDILETKSWQDVNQFNYERKNGSVLVTYNTIKLGITHSSSNLDYQYTLLPSISHEDFILYKQNPDVVVLENSTDIHAVKENSLKITAANIWNENGIQLDWLESSTSCALMWQETPNYLYLWISDPIRTNKEIVVSLLNYNNLNLDSDLHQFDKRILFQSGNTIAINTENLNGATHLIKLNLNEQ